MLRKRNIFLLIGVLCILFGMYGLGGALRDFRSGHLSSGTAALSQQPYGPFLRACCFSFELIMGFWFIRAAVRRKPGPDGSPDDKANS